jgi:hypothetical protein
VILQMGIGFIAGVSLSQLLSDIARDALVLLFPLNKLFEA